MNSPEVDKLLTAIGAMTEVVTKMFLDMVAKGVPPAYAAEICKEVVRGLMSGAKSNDPDT